MSAGSRSTSIRPLGKVLDAISEPVYLHQTDRGFVYFNTAACDWLGNEAVERLLVWNPSKPGAASESVPGDVNRLAESLQPPSILRSGRPVSQAIVPAEIPQADRSRCESKEVLFVPLQIASDSFALAIADCYWPGNPSQSANDLVALSRELAIARRQLPRLTQIGPLIGASPQAKRLRARAALAADSAAAVYLTGRLGCGGRQLALAIHHSGPQRDTPLATVDCALMDAELLTASLSPIAASSTETDDAMAAVLLQGVDELPADAQAVLEQFINEHRPKLRCLSTAQLSSAECVRRGQLRESLAIELSTLELTIPALADRITDLPLVVQSLIERQQRPGLVVDGITRVALDMLSNYTWPGDFEELEAAIRYSVSQCGTSAIGPQHLPLAIRSYQASDPQALARDRPIDLDRYLAKVERELIDRALEKSDGNRAMAARQLGISRARLLRRIAENDDELTTQDQEE